MIPRAPRSDVTDPLGARTKDERALRLREKKARVVRMLRGSGGNAARGAFGPGSRDTAGYPDPVAPLLRTGGMVGAEVSVTTPYDVDTTLAGRTAGAVEVGGTLGRYRVTEKIGSGAMGSVFRAWDPKLCRDVALKVLHAGRHDDAMLAARLRQEARALASISHPNVVQVFTVEMAADAPCSIAMELVDGPTLAQWIKTPRAWHDVLAVFGAAGRGLAAAHAAGLVHRDFKPTNVLVGSDGRVRVTDFGLVAPTQARARVDAHDWLTPIDDATASGSCVVVGTPAYMAPEQHDGMPADPRSDQFAFCVALWEALCGARPFTAGNVNALALVKRRGPPRRTSSAATIPRWVIAALRRGLAPRPEDRWPSMSALLDALARPPARARAVGTALVLLGIATGTATMLAACESITPARGAMDPARVSVSARAAGYR